MPEFNPNRRSFLGIAGTFLAGKALGAGSAIAKKIEEKTRPPTLEDVESRGPLTSVRIEPMKDANMPKGISRYDLLVEQAGSREFGGGSVFAWKNKDVQADLVSRAEHQDLFDRDGTIIPEKVSDYYKDRKVVIVAPFGYTNSQKDFDGIAIENGRIISKNYNQNNRAIIYFNKQDGIKFSHVTYPENTTGPSFDFSKVVRTCGDGSVLQGKYLYRKGQPMLGFSTPNEPLKYRLMVKCADTMAFVNIIVGLTQFDLRDSWGKIKSGLEHQFGEVEYAALMDTGACSTGAFWHEKGSGNRTLVKEEVVDHQFDNSKFPQSHVIVYSVSK